MTAGHDGHGSTVPVPEPAATPTDDAGRHAATEQPAPQDTKPAPAPSPRRLSDGHVWLWLVIWSLTGVATWMAGSGQVDTWVWAGLSADDPRRFGVPFVMELSVVGWLLIGKYAVSSGRSPYPWWCVAAGFSAIAVYANCVHGTPRSALIFGTASATSLAFWFAEFYLSYIGSEVHQGKRVGARPKVFGVGSIWQPRIDFRAFLIVRRREQVQTVERARELAELWIWIYQDTLAQRPGWQWGKHRLARRTAWMEVNKACGVRVIVPRGIVLAQVTFADPEPITQRPQRIERIAELPSASGALAELPAAPKPPTHRLPAARTHGGIPVISAPPANRATEVPEVPEELFEQHTDRISLVQQRAGDAWWNGPKPLTVEQVQKQYGIGNRAHASEVARCLKVLRAGRLDATGITPTADNGTDIDIDIEGGEH